MWIKLSLRQSLLDETSKAKQIGRDRKDETGMAPQS
jgi:hypothetical protein